MKTSVSLGNHACMMVPARVREYLRQFYVDTLGGTIMQADPNRDFIRIGDNFFMAFLYGNVEDISEVHRSARTIWLELQSDQVAETRKKITESGLVRILDIPDPHLYFQAPGGQCLRLVGSDEDLSFYGRYGYRPRYGKN